MPPSKKATSLEKTRKKKREAEKRRRARIKADPEKYEAAKLKEKQRREKRKAEKKIAKIKDLTPRQQRAQRKVWQERTRKCRRLKKERQLQLEKILRENTTVCTNDEMGNIIVEGRTESINQNESQLSMPPAPSTSFSKCSLVSNTSSRQKLQGALISRRNRNNKIKIIKKQREQLDDMKKKYIHCK